MNKKELELYVKKSCENVFKKLAENPEEMLNLSDLQDKYNNLLKEKIELKEQIKKQKEVIDKAINNSQYWIDYYTRLNSDERIVLRLQENIDILKEVE